MNVLHALIFLFPLLSAIWFGLWPLIAGRSRPNPPARAGLYSFNFNLTILALLQLFALLVPEDGLRRLFFQLSFFPLALLPWLWPIVGANWQRRISHLHPAAAFSAATIASLMTILVLTNEQHEAVWQNLQLTGTLSYPVFTAAGLGWVSWLLLLSLSGSCVYSWVRLRRQRKQVPRLVTAAMVTTLLLTLAMLWRPAASLVLNLNPAGWLLFAATALISLTTIRHPGRPRLLRDATLPLLRIDAAQKIMEISPPGLDLLALENDNNHHQSLRQLLPLTAAPLDRQTFILPQDPNRIYQLRAIPWPNPLLPNERLWLMDDITASQQSIQHQDRMLRKIIHDLRNPLSSSLTMLTFLEKRGRQLPSERQEHMVSLATRSLHRGINLVNRLADIHRLERGDMPLDEEIVDLPLLVDKAQADVLSQYREKELAIFNDVAMDLPPVRVDPRLLEQVLLDLLRNAAQFTPKGGEISVKARVIEAQSEAPAPTETTPALPEPTQVEVMIRDSGPGIPEEVQSRLFQKFETGNLPGQGTGLGLAFCRLALAAHDQTIWIDNSPAQGACFIFTLAIATEALTGDCLP